MFHIVLTIFVSLTIILIVQYLWNFLKDTYSTKKTRDLVGSQTRKYQIIIDELLKSKPQEKVDLTEEEKQLVTDDLSEFMESQLSELPTNSFL